MPAPRNLIAMSELRHDPLSGHDVIVAAGRAARPTTFAAAAADVGGVEGCPFCPGHESQTPPELARTGSGGPGTPGWRVRVFPNLYPIVGAHEVVVLSPDHSRSFALLDDAEAVEVVTMWRDRVRAHLDGGAAYSVAILNHLRGAGASIAHPHARSSPSTSSPRPSPPRLLAREAAHDLVTRDAASDSLTVQRGDAVVWCPYASSTPYLMRVAHAAAGARFDEAADETIATSAVALRDALARLRAVLGDLPYNLVVHTAPPGTVPFHWYVEVIPRVSVVAGFEQATGIFVNMVPPERAALELRAADPGGQVR